MTPQSDQQHPQVANDQLVQALEQLLSADAAVPLKIAELKRMPSAYASSFPLEELSVRFANGHRLDLIFKNVSPDALSNAARGAKPSFLIDPLREINAYQTLLNASQFGTARYYGSVVDEGQGRFWLFLEKVAGDELYTVGDFGAWRLAARWLSAFHRHFRDALELMPSGAERLVRYDRAYYHRWMERALSFAAASEQHHAPQTLDLLRKLAPLYPQLVEELLSLPVSLIHGEFYASNVIVETSSSRVCPVDWEQAAIGPGLVDLAALISGNWNEEQKRALADEYYAALTDIASDEIARESFFRAVDLCRLHLAIQWLGWSPNWSPPSTQQNDWLHEARTAASSLVDDFATEM